MMRATTAEDQHELKTGLVKAGISRKAIAKKCGVTPAYLNMMLNGYAGLNNERKTIIEQAIKEAGNNVPA